MAKVRVTLHVGNESHFGSIEDAENLYMGEGLEFLVDIGNVTQVSRINELVREAILEEFTWEYEILPEN